MATVIETDVLVIGGGGAAARAAIESHQAGAKTTLAVKGRFGLKGNRGTGATGYASPNYRYFTMVDKSVKPDEECEVVYQRIIQAGLGLTDRRLARILVDEAAEARRTLDKWGVVHPSAKYPPVPPTGIWRYTDPMPGLANVIRGNTEITVLERLMVTDLLTQNGMCVGAVAVNEENGETFLLKAGSTILATGGDAQLFSVNLHPSCVTGDGYAMGYDLGAELMNLEFMQMFVATAYPTVNSLQPVIWRLYPKILNGNGDEFISNYLPQGVTIKQCMEEKSTHGPFSTRDMGKYLEISITKEIKAGRGSEHDACYLEARALKRVPEARRQWFAYRGVDLTRQYVEITVTHQCSNGGLIIDENGQTTIPGLYAVGETVAGPHGADRLGGNMQTFCHVFGIRAGKHATATAKAKGLPEVGKPVAESQLKRIAELKECKGDQKPLALMKMLKGTAWANLLAVRSKEGLTQLLEEIGRIRNELVPRLSVESAPELVQALELTNLLQVGEIVANTALMREESRGGHYRDDFPEQDDTNWLQAITVKKVAGNMQLGTLKLDEKWEDRPAILEGWWG